MDESVQRIVAGRRLATGSAPRRSFTIERGEARVRLRQRPSNRPWSWTLALLHAGLVLAHEPVLTVDCTREGELDVWTFDLALPGADLDALDLSSLLDVAVDPDPGPGASITLRAQRLLARALNESLASEPAWAELVTPFAARRCERRESPGKRDPYDDRASPARSEPSTIRVRLAMPPRGLGRVLSALRDDASEVRATMHALWMTAMPWARDQVNATTSFAVRKPLPATVVALGTFGRWWPSARQGEVALVRDGLRIAQLDAALARKGLPSALLRGWIECDALHLTVDEGAVVEDEALDELAGWLTDALANSAPDAEGVQVVTWPPLPRTTTASGDLITFEELHRLASDRRELLFARPHEVESVPAALRTRVILLPPHAHEWIRRHYPAAQLVPVKGVLAAKQVARTDLTALAEGSLPACVVPVEPWLNEGPPLNVEVIALVHAHGVADKGAVVVLAWERSLGRLTSDAIVIPGVTLVARVADATRVEALQADAEALRSLASHVAASVRSRMDVLVRHALREGGSVALHRIPFLRSVLASLSARALELRYVQTDASPAVLQWRDDPLLDHIVANRRDGTPVSLRMALERARDVGGVVVGAAGRRWFTLEEESKQHSTWIPTTDGAELLPRILGRAALWEMPIVPQGMPHVAAAGGQRGLLLEAQETARLLLRASTDPLARARLLAHVLVARALGEPEQGLADVPLLSTYDPRAVEPARLRSVAATLADGRVFAVLPAGAGHRDLAGPIIEATAGEAALLTEVLRLPTVPKSDGSTRAAAPSEPASPRLPAVIREPVLSVAIVDALAVGALHLPAEIGEVAAPGIQIWAKGLRVGAITLPAPLSDVTGRLWLSDAGIRARHEGVQAIAAREGRSLVATALRQVALAPPGSPRRRALERFVGHCRTALDSGRDPFGLRALLSGSSAPAVLAASDAVAAKLPPLRRLWLLGIVRHALGRTTSVETTWLSWRAAKLLDAKAPTWTVELGSRHRWNKRALAEDASIVDVFLAACVAVADVLSQAEVPPHALAAALLRVLATAHAGPRS